MGKTIAKTRKMRAQQPLIPKYNLNLFEVELDILIFFKKQNLII